jgi:hypothetical protein
MRRVADSDRFLERAREAKRESKFVEFKEKFDPADDGEWIELIKDFVALANTGGGVIVIGLRNDGSASGSDIRPVLALDGATIGDKLVRYVNDNFDDFDIQAVRRADGRVAAIVVGAAEDAPLVFAQPGNYTDARNRQKTAFARGAIYVRHGAKSEPATRDDLRGFLDRRLATVRESWLGGIRRVVTAPQDAEIVAIQRTEDETGEGTRIRITTDETAPVYGRIDPDITHPYRQTELVEQVNRRLPESVNINGYDIQSVKRAHDINERTRPDFVYFPKFGWYQYSEGFAEWLVEQYNRNDGFFEDARRRNYELTHS